MNLDNFTNTDIFFVTKNPPAFYYDSGLMRHLSWVRTPPGVTFISRGYKSKNEFLKK